MDGSNRVRVGDVGAQAASQAVRTGRLRAVRAVTAGAVVGIDLVGRSFAYALLVFAGPLAAGADPAIVLFLLTGILATASALPLAPPASIFGAVQTAPLVILLPSLTAVGAATASLPPGVAIATAFAIIGASAVAAGLGMLLLARFDAGRMVRLMPYPVIAGFLAAAGALMVEAALRMIVPDPIAALAGNVPLGQDQVMNVGLAVALAILMRFGARLWPDLGAVTMLAIGVFFFFVLVAYGGLGIDGARAVGLLAPAPPTASAGTTLPIVGILGGIDLSLFVASLPHILAAAFISVLGLVLNLGGIEMCLRRELRSRPALLGSGVVNIATGVLGSSVSFVSSTATIVGEHLGGRSFIVAATACVVMGMGLLLRQDILLLVPGFVVSGLLLYVGVEILEKWFLQQRRIQTGQDWGVIGGLVLATILFGVLPAILIGIALSSVFFAVNYAGLDTISKAMDLSHRRSSVDRGPVETAVIDTESAHVVSLSVQGYLFFGSVDRLVGSIRALVSQDPPPLIIVLDFAAVSGMDAAAVDAMNRLEHLAQARRTTIVLAGLRTEVSEALNRHGIACDKNGTIVRAHSADDALQAAEALLIARAGVTEADDDARSALELATGDPAAADRLLAQMDRLELSAGETLIEMGEPGGDIFVIDRGRLAVFARGHDGRPLRLRSFCSGAVVGEVAAYLGVPRTADVIADEETVVYRLSTEVVEQLCRDDPETAAIWHRFAARMLADKLRRTTDMIREVAR